MNISWDQINLRYRPIWQTAPKILVKQVERIGEMTDCKSFLVHQPKPTEALESFKESLQYKNYQDRRDVLQPYPIDGKCPLMLCSTTPIYR